MEPKIWYIVVVAVVQGLSWVWLLDSDTHAIPWIAACQAPLSFTVSWSLFKLTSIESVLLFYHLILCRPLLLSSIFPSIRVFSSESALSIRWPKYWSFSIRPSNEYSALISFKDGASRSETGNDDSFVFFNKHWTKQPSLATHKWQAMFSRSSEWTFWCQFGVSTGRSWASHSGTH